MRNKFSKLAIAVMSTSLLILSSCGDKSTGTEPVEFDLSLNQVRVDLSYDKQMDFSEEEFTAKALIIKDKIDTLIQELDLTDTTLTGILTDIEINTDYDVEIIIEKINEGTLFKGLTDLSIMTEDELKELHTNLYTVAKEKIDLTKDIIVDKGAVKELSKEEIEKLIKEKAELNGLDTEEIKAKALEKAEWLKSEKLAVKTKLTNWYEANKDVVEAQKTQIKADLEEQLKKLTEEYNTAKSTLIDGIPANQLAELEKLKAELNAMNIQFDGSLTIEEKTALELKKAEFEAELAVKKAELEAGLTPEQKAEIKTKVAELESEKAELKLELEKKISELSAGLSGSKTRAAELTQEQIEGIEAKINEIKGSIVDIEAKIVEKKAELEAKITPEEKAESEAKIAEIKLKVEEKKAEIDAGITAEQKAAIELKKAEIKAKIAEYEAALTDEEKAKIAELKKTFTEMKTIIEEKINAIK